MTTELIIYLALGLAFCIFICSIRLGLLLSKSK